MSVLSSWSSAARSRTVSTMNNGFPAVWLWRASTTCGDAPPSALSRTYVSTSALRSPPSGIRVIWRSRSRSASRRSSVVASRFGVAVGTEHEHAAVADRSRQEPQQEKRGLVRRMEIVEDYEERSLRRGKLAQEGHDGVEQPEPQRFGIADHGTRYVAQLLPKLWQQLGQLRPAGADAPPQLFWFEAPHARAEQLNPWPVCRGAALLPAPAPHRINALVARMSRHLIRQTGLPDPGLAREEQHTAAPVMCVRERLEHGPQLRATAYEDARGARGLRHPRSLQRGVVGQDCALELLELRAWLEPELLDQGRAGISVDVQRVRLTSRAVQGEHQLATQALAERVRAPRAPVAPPPAPPPARPEGPPRSGPRSSRRAAPSAAPPPPARTARRRSPTAARRATAPARPAASRAPSPRHPSSMPAVPPRPIARSAADRTAGPRRAARSPAGG